MITPENNFFLFGMGHRQKYVYKNGNLTNIKTSKIEFSWNVDSEEFIYHQYTVILHLSDGKSITIYENEIGLFIDDLCIEKSYIHLPDFKEYKYSKALRILHHEVLINFNGTIPVPNIYVYDKAWYRDGAMMALVLNETGNIDLLKNWALSITSLYDMNNANHREPDNLGQLAFILSFFVDKSYPLVSEIVKEAKRIMKNGVLTGITDFNHHEIYSTLWLKYGLDKLGVDTSFINIPLTFDSYARMFWMNRTGIERHTYFDNHYDENYPYLWWAVKHFENEPIDDSFINTDIYPMSWERLASQAVYENIAPLSTEYAKNNFSAPHSWHASEQFMYLIEMR